MHRGKWRKKNKNKYCLVWKYGIIIVVECTDIKWGMKEEFLCFYRLCGKGGVTIMNRIRVG